MYAKSHFITCQETLVDYKLQPWNAHNQMPQHPIIDHALISLSLSLSLSLKGSIQCNSRLKLNALRLIVPSSRLHLPWCVWHWECVRVYEGICMFPTPLWLDVRDVLLPSTLGDYHASNGSIPLTQATTKLYFHSSHEPIKTSSWASHWNVI